MPHLGLTTLGVDFGHLVPVVIVGLLHSEVTRFSLPFPDCPLGKKAPEERGVPLRLLRAGHRHNPFDSLLCFSPFIRAIPAVRIRVEPWTFTLYSGL